MGIPYFRRTMDLAATHDQIPQYSGGKERLPARYPMDSGCDCAYAAIFLVGSGVLYKNLYR